MILDYKEMLLLKCSELRSEVIHRVTFVVTYFTHILDGACQNATIQLFCVSLVAFCSICLKKITIKKQEERAPVHSSSSTAWLCSCSQRNQLVMLVMFSFRLGVTCENLLTTASLIVTDIMMLTVFLKCIHTKTGINHHHSSILKT